MLPIATRSPKLGLPRVLIIVSAAIVIGISVLIVAWAWPVPHISIEPKSQDLGEMPQQHLQLTYTIRNSGRADLSIGEITTTCGCTKATVAENKIPPGGSTPLIVTMDPQEDNLYGSLFRVITVRSNDPSAPLAQVDFHVTIRQPGQ